MISLLEILVLAFVVAVAFVFAFAFKRSRRAPLDGQAIARPSDLPEESRWSLALRMVGGVIVLLALIAFYDFVFPAPPKTLYNFGMMMYGRSPKGAALSLITRACDGGAKQACDQLGAMYEDGSAGVRDYDKARAAYLKACDSNDFFGCIHLGQMYDWGNGVTVDDDLALTYYIKACNGGEMQGCSEAGSVYEMSVRDFTADRKQAFYYFRKACDGGQLSTCRIVGDKYEGEEGAPDHVLAREAYQKACNDPDAVTKESCTSLGNLYEIGLGGSVDAAQAKKLYLEACDHINSDAMGCLALGKIFESESNYEQARTRYQQACDAIGSDACFQLAVLYEKGLGVAADKVKARTLYQQACDGGVEQGCDQVKGGNTEERAAGPKVPAPRSRAASVASASSPVSAATNAAQDAALKHDEGAIRFYRKACDAGDARACESLGRLYEMGLGLPQDSSQSRSYYQKACEYGDSQGCAAVNRMR